MGAQVRALVTGSRGFVGRHMTEALLRRGYEAIGVDIVGGVDCRDFFRQSDTHYDLVVHCAAVVGGRTMIDGSPLELAVEDLTIDAEMFRWVMRTRPGRIVYFSSSAAYPVGLQSAGAHRCLNEDDIPVNDIYFGMPDATYGWVKLTGERLAAEANKAGIRTHVFRPFSGYGSDQDESYPFPAIIRRAINHPPGVDFKVWGSPESTRDWVHIDDVVACVLSAIDADDIGPMNICTGRATSFRELAELAMDAAMTWGEVVGDESQPMGVMHRVGNPSRMVQCYAIPEGWTSIEKGVARGVHEMLARGLA